MYIDVDGCIVCMHVCMHARMYLCSYACMHACTCVGPYVCACVCVRACMCVCSYANVGAGVIKDLGYIETTWQKRLKYMANET